MLGHWTRWVRLRATTAAAAATAAAITDAVAAAAVAAQATSPSTKSTLSTVLRLPSHTPHRSASDPDDFPHPTTHPPTHTPLRAGFGWVQWLLLCYCGLAWLADACETMLLSFLGPAIKCDWKVGPGAQSLLTSVVFLGGAVCCHCLSAVRNSASTGGLFVISPRL